MFVKSFAQLRLTFYLSFVVIFSPLPIRLVTGMEAYLSSALPIKLEVEIKKTEIKMKSFCNGFAGDVGKSLLPSQTS
jgi:hypothetical protein